MIHHEFRKGQKVFIILKNGIKLLDKYINKTSQFLELENYKIKWNNIRSTTIWRNNEKIIK